MKVRNAEWAGRKARTTVSGVGPLLASVQRRNSLLGPGDKFWEKYKDDLVTHEEWDEDNPDRRTLSQTEARMKFGMPQDQLIVMPHFEVHSNMWFTSDHMFLQQTNLDDVWRVGFSPIRWTGYRTVDWVEFDVGDKRPIQYNQSIMRYAISQSYSLGFLGQSLSDVTYSLQLPFHKAYVLTLNKSFENSPQSLLPIGDESYEYKWCLSIKYTMDLNKIFETPPIIEGRYGKWYDSEQYEHWIREEGLYKEWQMHQLSLQWEMGKMDWKARMKMNKYSNVLDQAFLVNIDPHTGKRLRPSEGPGGTQRYLALDEAQKRKGDSWLPKWWPW